MATKKNLVIINSLEYELELNINNNLNLDLLINGEKVFEFDNKQDIIELIKELDSLITSKLFLF
jgi:hypothetical protein